MPPAAGVAQIAEAVGEVVRRRVIWTWLRMGWGIWREERGAGQRQLELSSMRTVQ